MKNTLVFLLLVAIIIALFIKRTHEPFQADNRFKGSVHIRGKVNVLSDENRKVKFDKLTIKDSKTGLVSSIDAKKMAYLVNNKDHRLKLFCLGSSCIGKNHLDILNGENNFKLRDLSENQCLSSIGNKYIHWRESWKYQQHDDNDDAKFQLLQNPVTYRDCEDKNNINFKITPVGEQTNNENSTPDDLSNKAFKVSSDNYIRSKGPREQNVGLST
jgi:hypothetical protein